MVGKADFFEEYDALTYDVANSLYQQFAGNLRRWLVFVEGTPETAALLNELGQRLPREEWVEKFAKHSSGMGGGSINWPIDKNAMLGAQLDLFRIFGRGEWDSFQFAMNFLRTGSQNTNDITNDVVRHIFSPMARDLRRHIGQNWLEKSSTSAPASDRVVTLNHNSSLYTEAIVALNEIRDAVAASNDYADANDKKQRIAEITAGEELLKAPQISTDGFIAVTGRCLKYLADKFFGGMIGKLAGVALAKLIALLGFYF